MGTVGDAYDNAMAESHSGAGSAQSTVGRTIGVARAAINRTNAHRQTQARDYTGAGSCYIEFGAGRIGGVGVDRSLADGYLPRTNGRPAKRKRAFWFEPPCPLVWPLMRSAALAGHVRPSAVAIHFRYTPTR
jgi:hypothetical protein